jgi:hypothetical protein
MSNDSYEQFNGSYYWLHTRFLQDITFQKNHLQSDFVPSLILKKYLAWILKKLKSPID